MTTRRPPVRTLERAAEVLAWMYETADEREDGAERDEISHVRQDLLDRIDRLGGTW